MHKVLIVGGGAAGLMAAYASAKAGNHVVLIEKNEKLGKKIYITGKGRCNLTNDVPVNEFLSNVVSNNKFLIGAVNKFSPKNTMDLFEDLGLSLTVERGNRVFPSSNKASDVTKTLERTLRNLNVEIKLNTKVLSISTHVENDITVVDGVNTDNGFIEGDSVIVCTGGISYPLTGSTGDGYKFAKEYGHSIVELKPSLCGVLLKGDDFVQVQGLTLKNISITVLRDQKIIHNDFGELLFTHFGVSGPVILTTSSIINRLDFNLLTLNIDLKPALDEETLHNRLLREFKENSLKDIENVMRSLLPKNLINIILSRSQVKRSKKCCEITKEERSRIVKNLKNLQFKISGLRPIDEAIVTAGGVSVKEINPKTMESKLVSGLYFAGEVLDVDAFTGGFNLQIAFSTGYCAGLNA